MPWKKTADCTEAELVALLEENARGFFELASHGDLVTRIIELLRDGNPDKPWSKMTHDELTSLMVQADIADADHYLDFEVEEPPE